MEDNTSPMSFFPSRAQTNCFDRGLDRIRFCTVAMHHEYYLWSERSAIPLGLLCSNSSQPARLRAFVNLPVAIVVGLIQVQARPIVVEDRR